MREFVGPECNYHSGPYTSALAACPSRRTQHERRPLGAARGVSQTRVESQETLQVSLAQRVVLPLECWARALSVGPHLVFALSSSEERRGGEGKGKGKGKIHLAQRAGGARATKEKEEDNARTTPSLRCMRTRAEYLARYLPIAKGHTRDELSLLAACAFACLLVCWRAYTQAHSHVGQLYVKIP